MSIGHLRLLCYNFEDGKSFLYFPTSSFYGKRHGNIGFNPSNKSTDQPLLLSSVVLIYQPRDKQVLLESNIRKAISSSQGVICSFPLSKQSR